VDVLFVSPMSWGRNAGGPQVNYMLAREFRRKGHDVDKFDIDDALSSENIVVDRFKGALFKWKALRHIRRVGDEYDVIQAEHGSLPFKKRTLGFEGVLVASSVGLAHFYDQYHREYGANDRDWSLRSVARELVGWVAGKVNNPIWAVERSFETADLISLSGEEEYEYVANDLGYSSKAFLRQNALSEERLEQLKDAAGSTSERQSNKQVAFIGYWNHRKGAEDWSGIIRSVCSRIEGASFLLLGTGRSREKVLSDLPGEHRCRVEVVPKYDYPELPQLLSEATVGVLPSYIEGMPLGVLEMLASRIPVVAYNVPGPSDMLRHLPRPMMVPVGHEEKIASKVTEILQLRPDAYEELAQASQNVADRFRWDEIAEQYLARVEELRA
jgi:glycosyltransferase involved in cell wall biosynthesis